MPNYLRCPKCGHAPLPRQQALPAACPACGVVLAKVGQVPRPRADAPQTHRPPAREPLPALLTRVPERVDRIRFWGRAVLWLGFAVWGLVLIAQDVPSGAIGHSFIHGPLLVFHEAGHFIFLAFGEWMAVAGGSLAQLLLPLLLAGALLLVRGDPFGAAIGLWLFGVSLLDLAPYVYDALVPQLTLLSGHTGEQGGHDWIYLLESMGWRNRAQAAGLVIHRVGALFVLLALGWAAWVLRLQHARIDGDVLHEEGG